MTEKGYGKIERGERGLSADKIKRLAEFYGVSEQEVMTGPKLVPVVGFVAAGAEAHFYANGQGPFGEVPRPPNSSPETVAVEVRGDSLGPLFNRWLVYYDSVHLPPTPDLLGQLCVVGLSDDRVMVKKLMRGTRYGLFHLYSATESPVEDVTVSWAAKVMWMSPHP